ncbi:hypothetical protein F183_A16420 [Bryobacterales bacterium F-183]|nr:hypothetical protein F183_A16420 [Bryobacterales bacterium F-183]
MRSLLLGTALVLSAVAQEFPISNNTLLVSMNEPQKNCPEVSVRVSVRNLQGSPVSGLTSSNFVFTENQTPLQVTVFEATHGEYQLRFNSIATTLRTTLNVIVRGESGFGTAQRLTISCALRVTCGDLPTAIVGQPYSAQLQYSVPDGYVDPFFTLAPAAPVLTVNPQTAALTGQFSTPGNYNFTAIITVNDFLNGPFSSETACQIRINLAPITVLDYAPKSATACSPSFPITVNGTNFQRPQGNVGTLILFDNNILAGGTLNSGATSVTANVPATLLERYRAHATVSVSTRAAGITNIDASLPDFTFRRTPSFAPNFTTTTLVATGAATASTPLNVDVLDLDATTQLRITVGSTTRLITRSSAVGGRLVFQIPNELIALGGTARISLVNVDEANTTGAEYTSTCAPNSFRTISLGPPVPTITSLTPRTATACAPGFQLRVAGSNLSTVTGVEWDGTSTGSINTSQAGTVATAISAALLGSTGRTVQVRLRSSDTASPLSAPEAFTVRNAPSITSLSSDALPLSSTPVTLTATGANFVTGITQIRWGQTLLSAEVQSPTQLTFTLPGELLGTAGTVLVYPVNADEANPNAGIGLTGTTGCPLPASVRVANPSAILTSLAPSSEVAARPASLQVLVTGSGFEQSAVALVNGVEHPDAQYLSPTQFRVVLTAGQLASPGTLNIAIRNPNAGASTPLPFQVLPVTIGTITLSSNPSAPTSVQDLTLSINQSTAPARTLRATLALSFEPNADNLSIALPAAALPVFAAGGQTFSFDVTGNGALPAGALVRPGTVAGTVVVRMTALTVAGSTLNVLPSPVPEVRIVIPRSAPVISSARIAQSSGGFDLIILGYSPTRNLTQATVTVNTTSGTRVEGDTRFTVDLTSRFNDWYRDAASLPFGSEFQLRIPFTLANGDFAVIDSLTVTLTNTSGTSAAATARR